MSKAKTIVSLNCGSSSVKFAAYHFEPAPKRLIYGSAEKLGAADGYFRARDQHDTPLLEKRGPMGHRDAIEMLLESEALPSADAIGHRVVHGGPNHFEPEVVTVELLDALKRAIPLAPLHLPPQIDAIELVHRLHPTLPQVACFDTAFHRGMPEVAAHLPLPRKFWDEGIRKYGFHGLSYDYVVAHLGDAVNGAVVIAHLGNGASMAALRDGRPIDTTMGLTPSGGIMMGTRTGDLDPGVLLYLMQQKGYDAPRLGHLLESESGLLGVSGITSDMQRLLETSTTDPHAQEAIEMFCYQARKAIGALAASLGGLDRLVFTGGIGEHSSEIRRMICEHLGFLGVEVDANCNQANAEIISPAKARCEVRVIPTDEDIMVARHTERVLSASPI